MDDRLSLQLHSINASLLMIFGAVVTLSTESDIKPLGGFCLVIGVVSKVVIWMSHIAFNLQPDKPPKANPPETLASPPLDVD